MRATWGSGVVLIVGAVFGGCSGASSGGGSGAATPTASLSLNPPSTAALSGAEIEVELGPGTSLPTSMSEVQVVFAGLRVPVAVRADGRLAFTLPECPHGNTTHQDTLQITLDGQSWMSSSLRRVVVTPAIGRVEPTAASHRGGTRLAIHGAGFVPGSTVLIGGNPASDVQVEGPLLINCTTPPGTTGPAVVVVRHPEGPERGWDGFVYANGAPLALASAVSGLEDQPLQVVCSGQDEDGDALLVEIVSGPAHGALSGSGGLLTFTPAADWFGTDGLQFRVWDGLAWSAPAGVAITLASVNDAPLATPQTVSGAEDTALPITLAGSDVEHNPLTYQVVTAPAHGALSGTPPAVTYTPASDWNGGDAFTFRVHDGQAWSSPASVAVVISAVNDAPLAAAQSLGTAEDTALPITLAGSDVDGDSLTWQIVSGPAHGALSGTPPAVTYTPAADWNGSDGFTFRVHDGAVWSSAAGVAVVVSAVNDAPLATAQSVSTAEDTALPITLAGSDVESDPLTFEIVTGPAHGALSGTPPGVTYTPAADWNGADAFSFRVHDGAVWSVAAVVSVAVTAVDDPPTATAQSQTTAEDTPLALTLAGTDPDGESLTFEIVSGPAHGALSGTPPAVTYTPAANTFGADAFTFRVKDATTWSSPATVSLTVTTVDDGPTATGQSVGATIDTALDVTLAGTDPEGDPIAAFDWTAPAHGTLAAISSGVVRYTPDASYVGADAFTFRVQTNALWSSPATVSITVSNPPLTLSQASPATGPTAGGTSVTLTGSGFTGVSAVTFGGQAAASFTVVSPTQITCTTPAGALGSADVVVTRGASSATLTSGYFYGGLLASVVVSPSGSSQGESVCAIDGNGVMHVAWRDVRNDMGDIYYRRSSDGGLTWSGETNLCAGDGGDVSIKPAIAVSGSVVLVAWVANSYADVAWSRSSDGGQTWSSGDLLGVIAPPSSVSVAISGSKAVLVWNDDIPYVRRVQSSDAGATWSGLSSVSLGTAPSVAMSGNQVLVVWAYLTDQIRCRTSADGGSTWSAPSPVDSGYGTQTAAGLDGTLAVVVWSYSGSLYSSRSLDAGTTWSSVQSAGSGTLGRQVSVSGTSALFGYGSGGTWLRRSDDSGNSWGGPQRVDGGAGLEPGVALRRSGSQVTTLSTWQEGNSPGVVRARAGQDLAGN